jgi:methylmalonyl-CoA mutase
MEQHKTPGFLEDFPAVTTADWEAKIIEDLKGADYHKRLVWKMPDGMSAMPYYRAEHLSDLPFMGSLPGEAPYVRGRKTRSNDWDVRQDIADDDPVRANEKALRAIEKGVTAIGLHAGRADHAGAVKQLLAGIDTAAVAIHLAHAKDYPALFEHLKEVVGDHDCRGSLNFDPLGYYLLYGKPYGAIDQNMDQAAALIGAAGERYPGFRMITVNGQHLHHAGAGIVQELAFMLSQANEYLSALTGKGLDADAIAMRMQFRLAVGSDYFPEIAKLRAMKMLWSTLVAQYHPTKEESRQAILHAESSMWNKSVYDPYVNLLRTSTEAMSAAIGGADSILLHPFDATFRQPGDFSLRLARNQQIVLKHESYFDKVVDPAAGSYYIENLTDSIAKAAWDLFVETEGMGGFLPLAESGYFKEAIAATCQQRDMDIAMRRQVIVGTNQYPNSGERMLDKLQPTAQLSDLGGLRPYRGAMAFEALRLAVEHHESRGFDTPKVFLLTYGNLAMRKARAGFSNNFFGVAGYEVTEGAGYADAAVALQAALASGAHIVVLCSSDEEYAGLTGLVADIKQQSPATLVVVAGNPATLPEQIKQTAVDRYIHLRTNALEALGWFNEKLGVA